MDGFSEVMMCWWTTELCGPGSLSCPIWLMVMSFYRGQSHMTVPIKSNLGSCIDVKESLLQLTFSCKSMYYSRSTQCDEEQRFLRELFTTSSRFLNIHIAYCFSWNENIFWVSNAICMRWLILYVLLYLFYLQQPSRLCIQMRHFTHSW